MNTSAPVFTGVGVALVTLFDIHREVDQEGTARLAAELVELGVEALVVAGTTGESDTLDDDEKLRLFDAVRSAVGDAVLVAGTGAPSAHQASRLTAAARECGVDAVIARSPRGVADPTRYYEAVAEAVAEAAVEVPVLAYHFPSVAPPGIPLDLLSGLPVSGCKDSSGDPTRLLATLDRWPGWLYTGSSALLLPAGRLGCAGAILAVANAAPELCASAFGGDADAQRQLTAAHLACERDFPRGVKQLVSERFGTSDTVRVE